MKVMTGIPPTAPKMRMHTYECACKSERESFFILKREVPEPLSPHHFAEEKTR